ncbi:hypothetical protein [Aggregatilinea lenta]|uniref:hypothetical protein n=1 Tax=Aggregatilinea lenta TaxID=913108 RepID=UPI000E5B11F7|nr:hypothetical protein [Aggregatilinea lenta]
MSHLTAAVSEDALQKFLDVIVNNVSWADSGMSDYGTYGVGYDMQGHLEGGTLTLRDDGTFRVGELDIRWDMLKFYVQVDLSNICIGGGCTGDIRIFGINFGSICLPQWCPFQNSNPIQIYIDLGFFVAQEVSFTGEFDVRYYNASLPDPVFDPCGDLRDVLVKQNILKDFPENRNQWHIHFGPRRDTVDIDLFDFADIAGNALEAAIDAAIDPLLHGAIGNLVEQILDYVDDLVRILLDIGDDLNEVISDFFNVSWGKINFLIDLLLDVFKECVPIMRIDDPFTLIRGEPELMAVKIPIEDLAVEINTDELIVQATIGAVS